MMNSKANRGDLKINVNASPKRKDLTTPLTLKTIGTGLSDSSSPAPKTPAASASADRLFQYETPKSQMIIIDSWGDLCISPTTLVPVDQAQEKMIADGIREQEFYLNGNPQVKRCIYFLYGKEYKWNVTKEERLKDIAEMVDIDSGNFGRLKVIALSNPMDKVATNAHSVKSFLNMAVALKVFFEVAANEGEVKFGGIPGNVFIRFQKGGNCYMPAATTWYSLRMRQLNNDLGEEFIADVGQQVRRHAITDDTRLEKRVKKDNGYQADDFAKKMVHCCDDMWIYHSFSAFLDSQNRYLETKQQLTICEGYGVGLVFNFIVHDNFRQQPKDHYMKDGEERLGYWVFDGNNCDTEGEFHVVDSTKELDEFVDNLRKKLKKQQEEAQSERDELRQRMKDVFKPKQQSNGEIGSGANSEKGSSSSASYSAGASGTWEKNTHPKRHAMVLIGGVSRMVPDAFDPKNKQTKHRKNYFMLLNSWKEMPLVLVSEDYMAACEAKAMWLKAAPNGVPPHLTQNRALVAECSSINADADLLESLDCLNIGVNGDYTDSVDSSL